MIRGYLSLLVGLVALLPGRAVWGQQVVTKVADSFEAAPWEPSPWNAAPGSVSIVPDAAPGAAGDRSLRVEVRFPAAFGGYAVVPTGGGLTIPGDVKSITVSYKTSDTRFPVIFQFHDGWGRGNVNGKALEWSPRREGAGWQTSTFDIPEDWVRPVTLAAVATHNWADRQHENTVSLWLDDLRVTTDLTPVDPETGLYRGWTAEPNPADPAKALKSPPVTPLIDVAFTTGAEGNVFQDREPQVMVSVRNWKPGALTGELTTDVFDNDGELVDRVQRPVSIESVGSVRVPLASPRFGRYRLDARLEVADDKPLEAAMFFAKIAPHDELTEAQKLASPYGLNVHSGGPWPLEPFARAGIVWFRDYAFAWDWLERAKGSGDFGGWPHFPAIVKRYDDAGVHVMPVLQKSITRPTVHEDGRVTDIGPDTTWRRALASVVLAFPSVDHWELSNEYDLNSANAAAEAACDWRNYGEYHRAFGQVLDAVGAGGLTVVENGRAGIRPKLVRSQIERGYFDLVDVVNSHHYCGTDAPEVNYGNFNTGFGGGAGQGLFFDRLRQTSRAADADGRDRDHYLTEFGWDTLAGHVVTPHQQAVYLQRAWMLLMAAGVDMGFWFFDNDSENPTGFFGGCGLFDAQWQPKLSLVALAGLTARLPSPHYVGSLTAGENTQGYVFEQDGRLVAALWTIEEGEGPTVSFEAERLYDFLGNPIEGGTVRLTTAPVFAVGLDAGSAWYRQTAYSLDTDHLEIAAAGDPVEPVVLVTNNRDSALEGTITMNLPDGWTGQRTQATVSLSPGEEARVALPFTVKADQPLGMRTATFAIREGGEGEPVVKTIRLRVMVRPPLAMQVSALSGRPGKAQVTVKVANQSDRVRDGRLEFALPASWKVDESSRTVEALKPGEVRRIAADVTWTADWKAGETATVTLHSEGAQPLVQPLIPSAYALHRAGEITIDGQLGDWSERTRLPEWMLGSTMGPANARVHLAWSPQGLYGAFEVSDSEVVATDPRSFWLGDVLELWIDTADNKTSRRFGAGDHQFWLVPQVDDGRVYVGQWKRGDGLAATRYDIAGIESAARRTDRGYVMEFLLPAEVLEGYAPAAGKRLGLNVNLSVKGARYDREVYWPRAKGDGIADPAGWGSVKLVP